MTAHFALPGLLGDVPAGFVRIPTDARHVRRHEPNHTAGWFGPPLDVQGTNRFDPPHPRRKSEHGVCYLAEHLGGAMHEGVLRGGRRRALSRTSLSANHQIADASLLRDLVLIDLVHEPSAHGLEMADLSERPNLKAKLTIPQGLVYARTQTLVGAWLTQNANAAFPVIGGTVDGILYVSRFSPAQQCIALWDIAEDALSWYASIPLGAHAELETTLALMGIGLLD